MARKLFPSVFFLSALIFLFSCDGKGDSGEGNGQGQLRLRFPDEVYKAALAVADLPDTNDFILDIRNSKGESVYSGAYGDSRESMSLSPGSYTISLKSCEFDRPAFSKPQFGDEKCVIVPPDGTLNVNLECRQINSGVRLRISPDFITECPDDVIFVSSSRGRLMYGYREKRIAYFLPGTISVIQSSGSSEKVLLTRNLEEQEILTVDIKVASGGGQDSKGAITVSLDTTRVWTEGNCTIGASGDEGKGGDPENAFSVAQVRANAGEKDVWVCGYIVGGDLSKSSASFEPPFTSSTNLAIASRSSVVAKESCLSVSLPAGKIRDALNLHDHPENLGRRVYLYGDIVESYFGIAGVKNVSDFTLK